MPIFNTYIGGDPGPQPSAAARAAEDADQRLRRNIQWGVVRGMFLYSLLTLPIVFIVALIISAVR